VKNLLAAVLSLYITACGSPSGAGGGDASAGDGADDGHMHSLGDTGGQESAADAAMDAALDAGFGDAGGDGASQDPCCACVAGCQGAMLAPCLADAACASDWSTFCACEQQTNDTGQGCVPPTINLIICAQECGCYP
jgi:hypothetical protein